MKEKITTRSNFMLIASLLTFLVLTACESGTQNTATSNKYSTTPTTTASVAPKPEYKTETNASPITDPKAAVNNLKQHLILARDAANSGDFVKAKQHYTEFHDAWDGPIEKAMEKDDKNSYEIMEQGEKATDASLNKTEKPDKAKAVAGIELQIKALDAYAATLK